MRARRLLSRAYFGKRTFARHAVATQVVANGAGAAAGVLRSGEAKLWAAAVVYLARVSSWMLSTTRQEARNKVPLVCVRVCVCVCVCVCAVICLCVDTCEPAYLSDPPCRTPSCARPRSSCFSGSRGSGRLSWWPFPAVPILHPPTTVCLL